MRPVEIADGNVMGDDAAESLAGKPGVEMKGRGLDLEGRFAQLREIQIDRMIGGGTNRGWDTGEYRIGGAVNMTGGNQLNARMAS